MYISTASPPMCITWHVGQSFPKLPAGVGVVTFQVDGDELDWLLAAAKLNQLTDNL